jgi:putative ABC transport system substrate-binding protein
MKQREFITLLGGATAAQPLTVRAQQASRMRHIGVIVAEENDPEGKAQLSGFTQGLSDLGWTNGSNLHMDVRWVGGDVNQIRAFAKELVAERPPTPAPKPRRWPLLLEKQPHAAGASSARSL